MNETILSALIASIKTIILAFMALVLLTNILEHNPSSLKFNWGENGCIEVRFKVEADE